MSLSSSNPRASIERQLISNQLWETVAFLAKAGFMLGLTPWMLRVWGSAGYGQFALASSTFVLLSILDLGIRGRTRVALCRARNTAPEKVPLILSQSVASFSIIGLGAILAAVLATASHLIDRLIGISGTDHSLLIVTTIMTMLFLLSGLLLEPLVARGQIGRVKLATATGWLLAIPAVAIALWNGASITLAVFLWLAALICANAAAACTIPAVLWQARPNWNMVRPRAVIGSIRGGFWFSATNSTWLARTYGATILISALDGPATAGTFFILLRLSEIISALGAISCDVSLAELPQATTAAQRRRSFASSYSWAVILCAHSALVIGFMTPDFFEVWLHPAARVSGVAGIAVAALGLGSAFNRTATYAALGLEAGKTAARWGLVEALLFLSALLLVPGNVGLASRLLIASASSCALLPLAGAVSRRLDASSTQTWLQPFASVLPFLSAGVAVLIATGTSEWLMLRAGATVACGGFLVLNIAWLRRRHALRHEDPSTSEPALCERKLLNANSTRRQAAVTSI